MLGTCKAQRIEPLQGRIQEGRHESPRIQCLHESWAFIVSVDLFLESLFDGNQDTVYLTTANQGGAFISENGSWSAPWRSSFFECFPGFSTFTPQVVEAGWKAEDILFGSSEHGTTDRIITNTERLMNKRHKEEYDDNVMHTPGGIHVHQGSLIR